MIAYFDRTFKKDGCFLEKHLEKLTNAPVGIAPDPGDSLSPSIFRVLHEARDTSDTIFEDYDGKPDSCADDFHLTDKIISCLEEGNRPELLLV